MNPIKVHIASLIMRAKKAPDCVDIGPKVGGDFSLQDYCDTNSIILCL